MKIICIGRNYSDHAKELNNPVPTEPVFFMKPDSALLLKNKPFYIPNFTKEVHHEIELVVKINRLGKNILQKFANRYYNEVSLGIDFTARDVQQKLKEQGLPWEKAKAFDASAVLGDFIPVSDLPSLQNLNFSLQKNGEIVQQGNTSDMIFTIDKIIEYVSQFVTLKIGDLIYTGTPAGVGPVSIGNKLIGKLEDKEILNFEVR